MRNIYSERFLPIHKNTGTVKSHTHTHTLHKTNTRLTHNILDSTGIFMSRAVKLHALFMLHKNNNTNLSELKSNPQKKKTC